MELLGLGLLGLLLLKSLLSFKLEASFSDDGGILGLKVPDLPSDLSTDSDPVASGVEGEAVDGGSSIVARGGLLNIAEVKNFNLLVLSSGDNEVSSGGDGDGIDGSIVNFNAVLDVEGLVVPDLEVTVPSD